ncbi:hypothetical protein Daesc_007138 [Daldinia eschscholtzii]|uniref:Serine carboxypeptidase n=1 Tax=Daldinia eschscholtzii TaxID=292717 RepID=A0AAX6MDR6_9PEZI
MAECDAIEDSAVLLNDSSPHGVGLEIALPNFAKWFKTEYLPGYCASYGYDEWKDNDNTACFDTGAPLNRSTVFSRLASADYWQRQCELFFPKEGDFTYGSGLGKTASDTNVHTKGWQLPEYLDAESRLLWVNGEFDPWRSASVASEFRPGGPLSSTPDVPSILIPGSRHCNDLRIQNAVNPDIKKTQADVVSQIANWTNGFYMKR